MICAVSVAALISLSSPIAPPQEFNSLEDLLIRVLIKNEKPISPIPGELKSEKGSEEFSGYKGKTEGQEVSILYVKGKLMMIHFGGIEPNIPLGDNKLAEAKYYQLFNLLKKLEKQLGGQLSWAPINIPDPYFVGSAELTTPKFIVRILSSSGNKTGRADSSMDRPGGYDLTVIPNDIH